MTPPVDASPGGAALAVVLDANLLVREKLPSPGFRSKEVGLRFGKLI